MPILTDADMVPFRTLFADLACDKECKIKRSVLVGDGAGSQTDAPGSPVVVAEVLVLIQKPSSQNSVLRNYASLIASQSVWQVDFPHGQDVRQGDILDIDGSNKVLTVQETLEPGSFSISTSVLASETA